LFRQVLKRLIQRNDIDVMSVSMPMGGGCHFLPVAMDVLTDHAHSSSRIRPPLHSHPPPFTLSRGDRYVLVGLYPVANIRTRGTLLVKSLPFCGCFCWWWWCLLDA